MDHKIRIYATMQQKHEDTPIATLYIREEAEAEFSLARIETQRDDIAQRLREALCRPQSKIGVLYPEVPIGQARLTYVNQVPVGSSSHWQVAIGLLGTQAHLLYNLDDYRALIGWMERP